MIFIKDIYIVTQNKKREVVKNGAVVIKGDKIEAVGQSKDLEKNYQKRAKKIIDGRGKLVMPGLINTHTHLAMTLLRGYADDMSLEDWWFKHIYPVESRFTAKQVYWGSLLGAMEMVKSGTTCCADFYYVEDEVGKAVQKIGLRAVLGTGILDGPTFYFKTPSQALKKAKAVIKKDSSLVSYSIAPHMFQTTSLETYKKCKKLAKQYHLILQTHLAETKDEVKYCLKKYKARPVEVLAQARILDKNALLAHACWLTKKEIEILARTGASISHCPISNMKLASGVMPLSELLEAGVNLSLGTDGACSNNNLDMFEEMKMAALLHKVHHLNPTIASAQTILDMATINGAKALNMEREIGSIEPGKKADLIILNLNQPHLQPIHSGSEPARQRVVSHLVYAAGGGDVETVMVNGKMIMEKRKIKGVDEEKVLEKIKKIAKFRRR